MKPLTPQEESDLKSNYSFIYYTAYYIYPCQRNDPDVDSCLTYAANHLASHFKDGIPELDVAEVEPIVIDEIQLALGSGPDGYRALFKDIHAYGVSNLTVTGLRFDFLSHIQTRGKGRLGPILIEL